MTANPRGSLVRAGASGSTAAVPTEVGSRPSVDVGNVDSNVYCAGAMPAQTQYLH
ncbi:hypothetical protein Microterr_25780 [Microbacterium terricola]|uniref:Uncharacterized protein n=1 Tax=Microbacterium terricola TaxID=344163 RepID=A0ABM8E1T5_9MICO|nr:hypothetical protein Microterr_25780 [Microbacterium terricola]